MLFPLKMKRVRLLMTREDAPQAAMLLARRGVFEIDSRSGDSDSLPELPAERYQGRVKEAAAYLDKVLVFLGQSLPAGTAPSASPPDAEAVADTADYLSGLWAELSRMEEQQRQLQEQDKRVLQLEASLQSFSTLEIDLGLLNAEHTFLDIRVGTVPLENLERLQQALSLADFRLETFCIEQGVAHTLIAGPVDSFEKIARALDAAAWHRQEVPSEFAGYPEQVQRDLELQREPIRLALEKLALQRAHMWQELAPRLEQAADTLLAAAPFAELGAALHGRGTLTLLEGWVPVRDLDVLSRELDETLQGRYLLRSRDPAPAERAEVPTALRHRRWLAPFVDLIGNYGMPRYGELDPTVLFAITFVAMFGMMFGDVGHGLVIAVAGLLLRKRMPKAMPFMLLCGFSSALFGVLYGSFFGFEELFHPLWISPLSDPILMLTVALLAGIGLIAMATVLRIRNRLAEGRLLEALMGGKGVAGLVLYGGLCLLAYRLYQGGEPDALLYTVVLAAAAAILLHIWVDNGEAPWPERLLITAIEGFDTVMGYVSGTLSFLRISAFSMNHVALAIAVFTIAHSLDSVGYWVTVVLGNAVIILLEGAIVMIQALRLEYYEGFSRFLSGSGRAFRPLQLRHPFNRIQPHKTRTAP